MNSSCCFPGDSASKDSSCSAGDPGSILGSRRSPEEENDSPLQYSLLGNPTEELKGYSPQGRKELDTTSWLNNKTPWCLENPTFYLKLFITSVPGRSWPASYSFPFYGYGFQNPVSKSVLESCFHCLVINYYFIIFWQRIKLLQPSEICPFRQLRHGSMEIRT